MQESCRIIAIIGRTVKANIQLLTWWVDLESVVKRKFGEISLLTTMLDTPEAAMQCGNRPHDYDCTAYTIRRNQPPSIFQNYGTGVLWQGFL